MFKSGILVLSMCAAPFAFAQTPATTSRSATAAAARSAPAMDGGVQKAIAFERQKDRADAVQARKERRHPSNFNYQADRQANPAGNVKDPGSAQWQKDKTGH